MFYLLMKWILNAPLLLHNGLRFVEVAPRKCDFGSLCLHGWTKKNFNQNGDLLLSIKVTLALHRGIEKKKSGVTEEIEIPVPWGVVAGKVYGDRKGPPVLCIHGWLDNCNSFDNLIPLLPKDKFYVFIDLPGHGKSCGISLGSFYTFVESVSLVERIRRYFSWPYLSFLSHSFGANVSGIYSGTFPEKVDKLIFLDVLGVHMIREGSEVEALRSSIESYAKYEAEINRTPQSYSYDEAKKRLLKANESLASNSADILLERGTRKLPDGRYQFVRDIRHLYRKPTGVYGYDAFPYLSKMQSETMHIIAEDGLMKKYMRSEKYSVAIENLFSQCFQNCEHYERVFVPGKHHVHLCNPTHVSDHVTSMLNRPIRTGLLK